FLALMFVYQVRTTEMAVVTTFGKPTDQKTEPGAYWQWWPIHQVYKLDKRIRSIDPAAQQSSTRDNYSIVVSAYGGWAVDNATNFFPRFNRGSHAEADAKLKEMLLNAQKQVLGQHLLADLINIDPSKSKLESIEAQVLKIVQDQCKAQNYGIDLQFVRLKQIILPKSNSEAVMDRMAAERKSLASELQAKGIAEAAEIRANAEREARLKIDSANAEAQSVIAVGEREAAALLAEFKQNPELAKFLLDISALEAVLKNKSTLIMDGSFPLIHYLQKNKSEAAPATR
ncbi:MAG: protease modulator HflC, partial [Verrucomicrobia bacterium]|nr:protease modulator HflC [Verrucomicrobiota bacterium]